MTTPTEPHAQASGIEMATLVQRLNARHPGPTTPRTEYSNALDLCGHIGIALESFPERNEGRVVYIENEGKHYWAVDSNGGPVREVTVSAEGVHIIDITGKLKTHIRDTAPGAAIYLPEERLEIYSCSLRAN